MLPDGRFRWTPTEAHGGAVFLFTVEVTDAGGLGTTRSFTVTVDEVNSPPVLDPIPTAVVNEGGLATFLARAVDPDVPVNTLTYQILGAPPGASIDPRTGRFTSVAPDGGQYHGVVRVTDNGEPGQTVETGFTIVVNNVAPRTSVQGPADGVRGQPRAFQLRADDASAVDQAAGFDYEIDWGDGTRQTVRRTPGNGAGVVVEHVYANTGSFVVAVTARDKDGTASDVVRSPIRIHVVQVQDGTLVIGGTPGDDRIVVTPHGRDRIKVQVGSDRTTVHGARRIVVYGQAGDDDIRVAGAIRLPVALSGGAGDDRLHGGNGLNILDGGAGNDSLYGGADRDILIGGPGTDQLHGGDDLLIAGSVEDGDSPAGDPFRLFQVFDPGTSRKTRSARGAASRTALLDSAGGNPSGVWVRDNAPGAVPTGSAGQNAFRFRTRGETRDRVADHSGAEFADGQVINAVYVG